MAKTAKDIFDRVHDYIGGNTDRITVVQCRRSILDALTEIATSNRWRYLFREYSFQSPASYQTGTITYDSSTRTVTLSGGTFPTWADEGSIRFSDHSARVQTRSSGTSLILEEDTAHADSEASGISYVIYRDTFSLPSGTWQVGPVYVGDPLLELEYTPPTEWHKAVSSFDESSGGEPRWYTILGDPDDLGTTQIKLAPFTTEAKQVRLILTKTPRSIRYWDEHDGTVSVSGTTVTGTGTAFTSGMVGSYIRIGPDSSHVPTDAAGEYPYDYEAKITAYSSATSITIDTSITATDRKYTISDPVDIDYTTMWNLLFYAALKQMADKFEVERKSSIYGQYMGELRRAKGADYVNYQRAYVL